MQYRSVLVTLLTCSLSVGWADGAVGQATPNATRLPSVRTKPKAATSPPADDRGLLEASVDSAAGLAIRSFHIPGLAIAVVTNGNIDYVRGYGITSVKDSAPVDADTLFKVGSISKSITAIALALLVEDGLVRWDDALSRFIPELSEANPLVARLTIRQILSHQTGLNLDRLEPLLWPQPNAFRFENFVRGVSVLGDSTRDNKLFRYSNMNYLLAGEVVRRASGMPYAEFVTRRVLRPLDMDCAAGGFRRSDRPNLAQSHLLVADKASLVRGDGDVVPDGLDAAAGGIRCSALAMSRWLSFHLHPERSKLHLDPKIVEDIHSGLAVVHTEFNPAGQPVAIEAYGLGIQLSTVEDGFRLDHYGGVAGMLSYYAVYPAKNSGFAILTNADSAAGRKFLIDQLAALLLPSRGAVEKGQPFRAGVQPSVPPAADAKPVDAQAIAKLVGRYRDAWFGEVELCSLNPVPRFASLLSPRLTGRLLSTRVGGTFIAWDDAAVNSDALIEVTEVGDLHVQSFKLMPLARSDFDFGALSFSRVGDCDGSGAEADSRAVRPAHH